MNHEIHQLYYLISRDGRLNTGSENDATPKLYTIGGAKATITKERNLHSLVAKNFPNSLVAKTPFKEPKIIEIKLVEQR